MTDEQAALLRTVLERPDDDLPRLVCADWLDEHGQPERAEFVRVQCELAWLDGGARCPICDWPYRDDGGCEPGSCSFRPTERTAEYHGWKQRQTAYYALRERERELMELHWHPWSFPSATYCSNFGGTGAVGVEFRRGFVESVTCDLATFMGGVCENCGGETGDTDCLTGNWYTCYVCNGSRDYRTPGIAPRLFAVAPVTGVTLTDAVIHPSGGNYTYYVGGLGRFPREYWSSLENLPSRRAALDALSAACVAYGRANAEGMTHEVACDRCKGEGWYDRNPGDGEMSCLDCGGKGTIRRPGLPPLAPTVKETHA